ncbi:prion-like-(Q/N-rich) domain-bearing protein 25 [Anticarsia gemmatalis]|uniref:prion-like-(Q/N-rich) domain-bearing protein 25 n=1 Tax=Anticarsia gemmatalis TaxID=129554 RepID=UPI003F767733
MWLPNILLILGLVAHSSWALTFRCTQNSDCAATEGAFCSEGSCVCPAGQQPLLGNSICGDIAPYLTSTCIEDHQCSRLVTNFECRRSNASEPGNCFCREGFHYVNGRCWPTIGYESPCNRDEECLGELPDPFSLACDVQTKTCGCAPGYYRRQRGECRKFGTAVGDGCVLDQDCHFENGKCNINTFKCYLDTGNEDPAVPQSYSALNTTVLQDGRQDVRQDGRQHGAACDASNACAAPFLCSDFGCVCPLGYYNSDDGTTCYAELGSPSTEEQCHGLFAEVRDGICTCITNFYFEENMRDCAKVSRTISDSCVTDSMCHTFGVAVRCGEPTEPWSMRTCECLPERAVWDEERNMCRLFVGIGESCQVSSDCLAGTLEIDCIVNEEGEGTCACPENTTQEGALCLRTGLQLGDSCQATSECTETTNTECVNARCSCSEGYLETDGFCAPALGGTCTQDSDCLIENMVCVTDEETQSATCRCAGDLIEYNDVCWAPVTESNRTCNVTAQCTSSMGVNSACVDNECECLSSFHLRDNRCWPRTGLFENCARTSECFLSGISERVECRNSLCQCSFDYPYSEQLHTCTSSATTTLGSFFTIVLALIYVLTQ